MREIKEIIIHCSATPQVRDITATDIDRWHKERGYNSIGYHYVIRIDGSIELGRGEATVGAHCIGHNTNSIGVCYIGGCDTAMRPKDTRTAAQNTSLLSLVKRLSAKYPSASIHGHNEFANKACPAFDVQKWREENKI